MAYTATRRTLASLVSRALSHTSSSSSSSLSSRSRFAFALLDQRSELVPSQVKIPTRYKTSGPGYSPLNDPSPNWSNRPPKETILLDGCDYEHWLIVMEFPNDPKPSEEEMVNSYVKTLAEVVGRYQFISVFNIKFQNFEFFVWFFLLGFNVCCLSQRGGGEEEDILGLHNYLYWFWSFDFWRAFTQS